jgi:hypothetical protein
MRSTISSGVLRCSRAGSTVPRLTNNPRVYVFERMGWGEAPGCVVALSNDYFWSGWHTVTVQTHFGPNAHLHDFTGHNASGLLDG